jgi:hypothetical protein
VSKTKPKAKPTTVAQYLKACSPDDRVMLSAVREVILKNLDDGFIETMAWGFPTYQVPNEKFVDLDGKPLVYAALDAEKRSCAVYLTALYNGSEAEADFWKRWRSPSRRMVDLGATVVRFRAVKDLDLPLIGEVVASMNVEQFIESYHRTKD